MNDPHSPRSNDDEPQNLVGFRTNAEWDDLIAQTGALIGALDEIKDERDRKAVTDALAAIDAVHREALNRLVRLFKEGVLEQVVTDPAIKTLMGMYDMLPEAEAGCQKVWDFLPEAAPSGIAANPVGDPPHWSPAPITRPPRDGESLICHMEEGVFAIVRADEKLFAFSATCPEHQAPMLKGQLDGLSWICPHGPGCVYDVRNGARLGGGEPVECHAVRADDQRVLIGFGVPFSPKLPAY